MKITTEREATKEELKAISKAISLLAEQKLELIGTRPVRERG